MNAKGRKKRENGLTDVTRQLSEVQQAALFTLLTWEEPQERGVEWDWDEGDWDDDALYNDPTKWDDIELARRCLLQAWPVDEWNRRVEDPDWGGVQGRRIALLEEFRSEHAAE